MFSNVLIYFVVIPVVMLLGLYLSRNMKQIRAVAVAGSSALIALSVWLLVDYLQLRAAGETAPMLYLGSWSWFMPLNIKLSVGVDGISIAMLAPVVDHRVCRLVRLMEDRSAAQGVFPVADPPVHRCVRLLYLDRPGSRCSCSMR